jgi:hypothetical protein
MINRLAMIEAPDNESWSLVRFSKHITKTLYLVEMLSPKNGEPLGFGSYFLDLRAVMLFPGEGEARAKIFDDWTAVRAYLDSIDEPAPDKVVKLVKS